ncbi:MAG: T9SS type A sorting domain-containing protein [Bacteroidetes bacterium]|nr:T9SS type A sorting domain-containing protein [Bacteroidota bacterium]
MTRLKTITIIAIAAFGLLMSKNLMHRSDASIYTAPITGNATLTGTDILYDGLISPGHSPGKITVTGDFAMGSGATYKCELKDPSLDAGVGYDQINVTGTGDVALAGTLEIELIDGYTPADNHSFEIMAFTGSLNGTEFTTIDWAGTMEDDEWKIDYGALVTGKVTIYGPTAPAPLPVELLNFRVAEKSDKLVLSWQTASEQNSDYFDIEHSTDAKSFSVIGKVKAQGTSYVTHHYSYRHLSPVKGINYYRLRQVDLDRKFEYSHIVSARLGAEDMSGKTEICFYPNPAIGNISFYHPVEQVIIYDITGKAILIKEQASTTMDISALKAGIYIVDINQGAFRQRLAVGN